MKPLRMMFFAVAIVIPAVASAHFPFLHLKTEGSGPPALHVYFAETAEPDDPALLDRIADADAWRLGSNGPPEPIPLKRGKESLVGSAASKGPSVYGLTKDYGVLARGGQPAFRLLYYAKTYSGRDAWSIATAERLPLDISPVRTGDELSLTVTWQGKPLPGAEVVVQGGLESLELQTDARGRCTCKLPDPDLYSIRSKYVEPTPGESDGKAYGDVRHYATLTLALD